MSSVSSSSTYRSKEVGALHFANMSEKKPLNPVWTAVKPFLNGGLAGMGATCVIQPVDMVKVLLTSSVADIG